MKKLLFFSLFPFLIFSQTQIGNDIDGQNTYDRFGISVSLSSDGNILAVGSPFMSVNLSRAFGKVQVFKNLSGVWTQIGDNLNGIIDEYHFGSPVSLSSNGNILAISNFGYSSSLPSFTKVYENISGVWTQIGNNINGSAGNSSLSSDGSIIAVTNSDQVIIYRNISGIWTKIGNSIEEKYTTDLSISSDGTILALGIRFLNGVDDGSARTKVVVYKNISGVWTQIGTDIGGQVTVREMSISLSSDGSILAIGNYIPYSNNISLVRIFKNISGVWTQVGENISKSNNDNNCYNFGFRVSLSADGTIVAIGARESDREIINRGCVQVYKNLLGIWTQIGSDIIGEARDDASAVGLSLSSDGTKLAVGAPGNDGNGETSGHVRVFDLSGILSSDSFVLANFSVYPNPASSMVTITLQEGLLLEKVNIYNTLGQLLKSEKKNSITVNSLTKGSYFFEVVTNKGKATKTIIIK